ncbi:hypothetical protein [Amycolatopsis sp. MtRt-6]|uniref:hypothetical protein n=1 Tax=Amycolatopsis sp. MtRt-6 TaxID=2792782 RepID=UPI001A8F40C8|nr:hypothetical protein [Amycolatopsis sp. MtRt-6]
MRPGCCAGSEIDAGTAPGRTSDDAARIAELERAELEREVRELRRVNEVLETASVFFAAAELDRKSSSV